MIVKSSTCCLLLCIILLAIAPYSYCFDKIFVEYADKMDKKYFAVFLTSINMIRKKDYKGLALFYDKRVLSDTPPVKPVSVEAYDPEKPSAVMYKDKFSMLPSGYDVTFPINWKANPANDETWMLYFQSLNWLDDYLTKGGKGDLQSAMIAFKVINDWLTANPSWPSVNGKYVYDEHSTVLRLKIFHRALRVYKKTNFKDQAFLNLLLTGIINHIAFLASEETYNWHNRWIIVDAMLLEVLEDLKVLTVREELQKLAAMRLFEQFRNEFTTEGVHNEHSPCYHVFTTGFMYEALDRIKKNGQAIPTDIQQLVDKSAVFYTYMLEPDGTWPAFGDCSSGEKSVMQGRLSRQYFSEYPEVKFSLTSGKEGVKPDGLIKLFPESGYAIFRDKWPSRIYAAIKAEFHSFAHYHEDDTSFILNAYGKDLIVDSGIHTYNKSPLDSYMRKARAHNVLLVDDKDFNYDVSNTGLSGITRYDVGKLNSTNLVEFTHPHYARSGVAVFRQFGQMNDEEFVVRDIYESSNTHFYSQLYHFAPGAKISYEQDGVFKVSWKNYPHVLWLKSDFLTFDVIEGDKDTVQGWNFPKFGKAVSAPVLKLNRVDSSGNFLTYISITKSNQTPKWDEMSAKADTLFPKFDKLPRIKLVKEIIPERLIPLRNIKTTK